MAVNKNFVVKNGLEVDTNLILADANTNKVGIGTSSPNYELHVNGGIGVTNATISGFTTSIQGLRVGTGGTTLTVLAVPGIGFSVGVGSSQPAYLLDVRSPVSTGQTALYVQGDVRITGDLNVDDITFDDATVQNLTVTDTLYVGGGSGVSTFVGFATFQDYVYIQDGLNISGITTISNTTDSTTFNNGALVIDGGLGVEKSVNIGGNLDITGSVSIGGTAVTLNSTEVFIENKDIILGYTTAITPNDDTANHAGIAIASTEGSPLVSFTASGINTLPDTYKQMMWFRSGTLGFSTDAFGFNYGLAIGTTTMASGVRLAVGSDVTVTDTTVASNDLLVAGVSTLGSVKVSSGIVTATTGIVTYYGDGSKLTGVIASSGGSIGVGSESTFVGAGITEIYFATTTGTSVNVVSAGTSATVTINPGVSLGLAIALGG